jgi:hypothetical protein
MSDVSLMAEWLQATSPYGMLSLILWAFWRVLQKRDAEATRILNKKDSELQSLYKAAAEQSARQTEAMFKVEAALIAVQYALEKFAAPAPTARAKRTRRTTGNGATK